MAENNLDSRLDSAMESLRALQPQPTAQPELTPGGVPIGPDGQPRVVIETPRAPVSTPDGWSFEDPAKQTNELPAPTIEDADMMALLKKRNEVEQTIRSSGGDYFPNLQDHPDDVDAQYGTVKFVKDLAAGFNDSLAKAISLPRETVDRGMAMLGLDFMEHGSAQQQTVDALNRMGIPTYQIDNLANKLGEGALPALATYAALQVSAPHMAAAQGTNTAGYLMREIGGWAMKHPILGLWLGQTGAAGGKVATETTGSDNPLVQFGGELVGGMAGGAVAATGRGAAKLTGMAANKIAEELPGPIASVIQKYNPFYKQPAPVGKALIDRQMNAGDVQNFAENQVAGLSLQMDEAINRAVESVARRGTAANQSRAFHESLVEAERISNRLVSQQWGRVNQNVRIPVTDMQQGVMAFRMQLRDTPSVRPDERIREALRISSPIRHHNADGTVTTRPAAPTLRRLRDFMASIRNDIVEEEARDAPRDGYIRNLNQLRDVVEQQIADALPNDTTIAQARAASIAHHDRFSRGPIADILARRYRGDYRIAPSESVNALMDREGGLEAVQNISRDLSATPGVGQFERQTLQRMVSEAEQSIRNDFREAAAENPQAGVRFVEKNAEGIRGLARVSAELELAANKVQTAMQVKRDVEASALARFAQADPEKAVARIFSDKNPLSVARILIRNFDGDPQAMAGLQNAVMQELVMRRAGADPVRLQELVNSNTYGSMLQEVLSSDQFTRLKKIADIGARITTGEGSTMAEKIATPLTIFGRVIGAQLGRAVASNLGGSNIQTPGIFAQATAKQFERLTSSTSPQDFIINATLDPHWEKLLYSRIPTDIGSMRSAMLKYRRLAYGLDTAREQGMKALNKESDE
jgi:hypothetical protein